MPRSFAIITQVNLFVPNAPILYSLKTSENHEVNACTQTDIRFFSTVKYEILQFYPNSHSFFYNKIQNFTVASKQPSVFFYSEIQKFENCTQTAIRSLTMKYENFKVVPKWQFVFCPRHTKFEVVLQRLFVFYDYKQRK